MKAIWKKTPIGRNRGRVFGLRFLALLLVSPSCADEAEEARDPRTAIAMLTSPTDCPEGTTVIEGTDRDDVLIGTKGSDCILGYGGNDIIIGGRGDDFLSGGEGRDALFGGRGDDVLLGGPGDDRLHGGPGRDIIYGGDGDDRIHGGVGADTLMGDSGDDVIRGGPGNDEIFGGPGDDDIKGGSGNDEITDEVGGAAVSIDVNNWPEITGIVPTPTRVDVGESTALAVAVADPDGDPLQYSWEATCDGIFSDVTAPNPVFTLETLEGALCALTVTVVDGRGGEAMGAITLETGPALPPL
jgi:hypothetical protein